MCAGQPAPQQSTFSLKSNIDNSFDAWGQATGLKEPVLRSARAWSGKSPDRPKPKNKPASNNRSQLSIREEQSTRY